MKRYCYLFPGQGAQKVGMGKLFYENFPESRDVFDQADDLLHQNLAKIIFEGPENLLTETKTAQPALYVTSLAILAALKKSFDFPDPCCCAGLSLGEYTALTAANVLSFPEGLTLVSQRGKLMHEACEAVRGSMMVVLGLDDQTIIETVKECNLPKTLFCANFNCPGQVVLSGSIEALACAEKACLEKGAKKTLPLQVHGAFHSGLMHNAAEALAVHLQETHFSPSEIPVAMNTTGTFVQNDEYRNLLQKQVTSSVLWHACINTCLQNEVEAFIEIGPGNTLSGLNKRMNVPIPTLSIQIPQNIQPMSIR